MAFPPAEGSHRILFRQVPYCLPQTYPTRETQKETAAGLDQSRQLPGSFPQVSNTVKSGEIGNGPVKRVDMSQLSEALGRVAPRIAPATAALPGRDAGATQIIFSDASQAKTDIPRRARNSASSPVPQFNSRIGVTTSKRLAGDGPHSMSLGPANQRVGEDVVILLSDAVKRQPGLMPRDCAEARVMLPPPRTTTSWPARAVWIRSWRSAVTRCVGLGSVRASATRRLRRAASDRRAHRTCESAAP